MQHLVFSEAGHNHRNEDCTRAQFHPYKRGALIAVLADGHGGQFGGGAAARVAVQKCFELALARSPAELLERQVWREILQSADVTVEAESDAGFTTLIGLCATNAQVCGASCGDSAALLIQDEDFVELTAAQRKNPPVGSGSAMPIPFSAARLATAPLLLLSDGAWKGVGFERIARTAWLHSGADLVMELRDLQLAGNGGKLPDDFSIIAAW